MEHRIHTKFDILASALILNAVTEKYLYRFTEVAPILLKSGYWVLEHIKSPIDNKFDIYKNYPSGSDSSHIGERVK